MKTATAALCALLLAGCAAESPQPVAEKPDHSCITIAQAAANNRSHGWRTVVLDKKQLDRAIAMLRADGFPADGDGGFFTFTTAPFAILITTSGGCADKIFAPISKDEVAEIVGLDH